VLVALRHPQFRIYFAGQVVSTVGDQVTTLALAFAVLGLTDSTAALGSVLAATTIGLALFVLPAGVIADRVPRQRLMLASDLVRGLVVAVAAVDLLVSRPPIWHLIVLFFVYGAAEAFFRPASIALLPQIVEPEQLQQANALNGFVFSIGSTAGPTIAGILIVLTSPAWALVVDAGTFVVSALSLALLRPRPVEQAPAGASMLHDLRGGWRVLRTHGWILAGLGAFAVYHAVPLPALLVLGPKLANDTLGGASAWATVQVGFGIGQVFGGLLATRWRPARPIAVVFTLLVVGALQPLIASSGLGVPAIAVGLGFAGCAVTFLWTIWDTTMQQRVPSEALSRVSSYDFLASVGAMSLGMALVGPVAGAGGMLPTMRVAAVVGVVAAVAVASLPVVRAVRR
jgi:MFS family permease